jgi:predicted nucleotidyltransferase
MRLTPDEAAAIRAAVAEVFGPTAVVRLFGSRVDDAKKGGDIDLLVEVPEERATFRDECALLFALEGRLGERKIDLLLVEPGRPLEPIAEIALRDGVRL